MGGGGGGGLASGSAMLCGIRNSYIAMASLLARGDVPPPAEGRSFWHFYSSEISVLHQFLSVSDIYFLLICILTTCI